MHWMLFLSRTVKKPQLKWLSFSFRIFLASSGLLCEIKWMIFFLDLWKTSQQVFFLEQKGHSSGWNVDAWMQVPAIDQFFGGLEVLWYSYIWYIHCRQSFWVFLFNLGFYFVVFWFMLLVMSLRRVNLFWCMAMGSISCVLLISWNYSMFYLLGISINWYYMGQMSLKQAIFWCSYTLTSTTRKMLLLLKDLWWLHEKTLLRIVSRLTLCLL